MKLDRNKVVIGMSGGVDSTASAYLLKERGYEVIGVTMKLFVEEDDYGNKIEADFINDARIICEKLEIEHYVLDLTKDFNKLIIESFIKEYSRARTPNPCVLCNKNIKYGKLMEFAFSKGAYYLATGHYANIYYDRENNVYRIKSGKSNEKDQGYLLNQLSQDQLKHLILPLGKYTSKAEVRKVALNISNNIARKKDSVGICFIKNSDYRKYIKNKIKIDTLIGNFVDTEGNILGKHSGIYNFTIGQKRNLGLLTDREYYVVDINSENNNVVLGDDIDTYSKSIVVSDVNFTDEKYFLIEKYIDVKVCQWGYKLKSKIRRIEDKKYLITFIKPERAISKGQYAVFYLDDEILGGGYIENVIK
ncbi:tRNA 2-thiouridine(34) synthase MnmA [Helicovermis profundi]|uniref:tRNA-specific 2-thiouridylase MnmA n=2 Tax=Helicovermis profundi TaxID=3065157 RepID=A0AAU9E7B3_9FIRM|nr:tRNA 2-thiouridine(34) synthase MnmA [Clostridia bacterium S502]